MMKNIDSLRNLQLNKEALTLCEAQQAQLTEVINKLLKANFDPREGSLLIIRAWNDGSFERILDGNLAYGSAKECCIKTSKEDHLKRVRLVNEYYKSNKLVGREVSEALNCNEPESFYHGKLRTDIGSIYVSDGHCVLSLPIENGCIIASFHADYRRSHGNVGSSVSEAWQHELMLLSLAETLYRIMPGDKRLETSLEGMLEAYAWRGGLSGYAANSELIQKTLARKRMTYFALDVGNSKLPSMWHRQAVAYA